MIGLVRDTRVINVLAKFENDPWKIMDVRVLSSAARQPAIPPARTLGVRQYPGALKGCGVKTRASLGHVAPLGWPRSIYKGDIECRFVSRNGQMTLKVRVNTSHFQYQLWESKDAYLVQIWWF